MIKILIYLHFSFLIVYFECTAQVNINFNRLLPTETSKYMQPLATYLGTYFNTGCYYTAEVPSSFGFKFSIIGMWSVVPDNQKTFNPEPGMTGANELSQSATVFGNKASYFLSDDGFFIYPTGLALKDIPSGVYQVSLGLLNTEILLRFFPNSKFNDVKIGVLGIGLKHEISSHFSNLPIKIAVQLLYNELNFEYAGDEFDEYNKLISKNYAVNIHVSKTFIEMFILYTGLQYESSSMDLIYYFDDSNNFYPNLANQRQSVIIDGDNHIRYTLGSAMKIGFFVINTDMNVTSFTTFSLGLTFDF